jgi:hypothetical protein
MAWQKKAKPTTSNWQIINFDPRTIIAAEFDIAVFDESEFGKISNVAGDNWVKKAKPGSSSWNKKAKPTS